MFGFIRLQLCCLILMIFLGIIYAKSIRRKGKDKVICSPFFEAMLFTGDFEILMDGLTAYTVNNPDLIPHWLNLLFHLLFFVSLNTELFLLFLYITKETDLFPQHRFAKLLIFVPYIISVIVSCAFIPQLDFIKGKTTDYSMGISVYACFAMIILYLIGTVLQVIARWNFISVDKKVSIISFLGLISFFLGLQVIFPEVLFSSAVVLLTVVGVYLISENPLYRELNDYNADMVMGFATLVENRDDNTGGHVKRTSAYVELLAKNLRKQGLYKEILSADYIQNLKLAAPMHDVGKIAIPDAILQKPARLTVEEFEAMKKHTILGSEIILETFGETANKEYTDIAYDVARFHHEKWNGKGYPEGLEGTEIPLCARIMAIADVFDAVIEKRCYKEAVSLDESFVIIENGRGTDFDPELVDVFLSMKDEIRQIHHEICGHH